MTHQITVKHGKETLQLDWSLDRPVVELQERLEELTGLMVRRMHIKDGAGQGPLSRGQLPPVPAGAGN